MSTTPRVARAPVQEYSPALLQSRLTDPKRLEAVRASALLVGAQNPVLDRLTRLVTRVLGVPVSLVSLVDDQGQHFPGLTGLSGWAGERRGTPLTHSLCQHVVGRDAMLVVDDASVDPLVTNNLAFHELGMVAYLGVPLRTSSGDTIGALCAIDTKPLQWSDEQIATLEDLAVAAMAEIELRATTLALLAAHDKLRAQATRDALTGLLNRLGFSERAHQTVALAQRMKTPFTVLALDLDGFKQINDTFGHDAGDEALIEMATVLQEQSRNADIVGRMGGDEFVVLCPNTGTDDIAPLRQRIVAALDGLNAGADREYALVTSVGSAVWDTTAPMSLATLPSAADASMYENKRPRKSSARLTSA